MSEDLEILNRATRAEQYAHLLPQLESLVGPETDFIANVANLMAGIHTAFGFLWVGCYFVKDGELVLGPFQGPVACTRIKKGKGVCGTAWEEARTLVVPDVDAFPGHIACSSASRSEIVVPVFDHNKVVIAVIDVDSTELNDFSETDSEWLGKIADIISTKWHESRNQ
jgi:GAF domain-containing protein